MAGAEVIFSLLILLLYVIMILRFRQGFKKYPEFHRCDGIDNTGVSIVVAFRNESANLVNLLKALTEQNYPERLYEVIMVDDHSDDGSDVLVRDHCEQHANFRYLINGLGLTGKKAAIRTGVFSSKNDLIVTTDADCTMGPEWLKTIAAFYQSENPDMIIGLVHTDSPSGFLRQFNEAEFSALIASGAGAAAIGYPIYCNAANLAFKKSSYINFRDPIMHSVASGDDTFLLHHLIKSGKKTVLLKSSDALVNTQLPKNWLSFLQQRIRWASKSRYYRNIHTICAALLVFGMNLLIIWSVYLLFARQYQWLFPVLFAIKFFADYLLADSYYKFLSKRIMPGWFFLYSIFYPLFTVIVAFAGFAGNYSWKGRNYRFGSKILISKF